MKIPFCLMPGSWGLKGKSYAIAKAEYELSGFELDSKLLEIEHADDQTGIELAKLKLLMKYNKITQYEFDTQRSKIDADGHNQTEKLAQLDVELLHKKIDQTAYDRQRADILGEPWVSIPKVSWDPVSATKTFFEIDYNEPFLNYLKDNGYQGSEEEIINKWLNDVCVSIATEFHEFSNPPFNSSRRSINGLTEYS